ncbi:Transposase IS66 family protein [Paraburkholderia susongensis]|uniref:Transposase IS66 family protein n=1 Tax=Paraburkholderia susongensis TaxID=1515439 RepID=A0A1X7M6X9_9BURK|nr:Transposase IS66 family protein [Paraburkholderia susongensis]
MPATLSRKSDTSRAILYALNRWEAFTRYCDDGQLEIDNLPVERALRGAVTGRSLCTSLRNLGKHWELPSTVVATRAMFARQRSCNCLTA